MISQVFSIDPSGKNPLQSQTGATAEAVAGLYVFSSHRANQLRLNVDGSFWLRQGGKTFDGSFTMAGNRLTMQMAGRTGVLYGVMRVAN